jgi:hypothetical protein
MSQKLHNPKSHAPAIYIPCWLSQIPTSLLSYGAKMTYGRLSQWADNLGHAYRSSKNLAQEIGTSEKSIERYLKELRDKLLIGTYHPQAGGINHFEFYDHPWMHESIKEQLVYKNDTYDPPSNVREPLLRSEGTPPSNVRDINKKEIKEIKCVGADATHAQNLPISKKQKAEKQALESEEAKSLFDTKFEKYEITLEELFTDCKAHYDQKGLWATEDRFIKWIESEKPQNYKKIVVVAKKETPEDYNARIKRYMEENAAERARVNR